MASTLCAALFACRPARETHASGREASAATVDRPIAANSRHDVKGLLANFYDSSAGFLFGEPDVFRTRAAMRPTVAPMFQAYRHVHAETSRRIIVGPFVVDPAQPPGVAKSLVEAEAPSVPEPGSGPAAAPTMARSITGLNEHDPFAAAAAYGDGPGLGAGQVETSSQRPDDPEILYASPP